MKIDLTPGQKHIYEEIKSFIEKEIIPFADRYDEKGYIPDDLIRGIGEKGYLGACLIDTKKGGSVFDWIVFGLLCEEFGRGSASVLSLLVANSMVLNVLYRWGTLVQKKKWLRSLSSGNLIGAFALSEPDVGSDGKSIQASLAISDDDCCLNGKKKWISIGQIADLFLVIAQSEGQATALFIEKHTPGLSIKPIKGMLGFRSAMLAELDFSNCRIPAENIIGKPGFGFSHIAGTALDLGRYGIAWGAVGLSRACMEASIHYVKKRHQFGSSLGDYQMIQSMLAEMITKTKAARLLCLNVGYLKNCNSPEGIMETVVAKYYASKVAMEIATDAVQIHGANGCSSKYPVQRYFRDAKILEIIEGSSQIHKILIAMNGLRGQFDV